MGEIGIYDMKLVLYNNSKWSDTRHRLILEGIENIYIDSV